MWKFQFLNRSFLLIYKILIAKSHEQPRYKIWVVMFVIRFHYLYHSTQRQAADITKCTTLSGSDDETMAGRRSRSVSGTERALGERSWHLWGKRELVHTLNSYRWFFQRCCGDGGSNWDIHVDSCVCLCACVHLQRSQPVYPHTCETGWRALQMFLRRKVPVETWISDSRSWPQPCIDARLHHA